MLVYTATKDEFCDDVRQNRIDDVILDHYKAKLRRDTTESEKRAWQNSMKYMYHVVEDPRIHEDVGIAIEYSIPQTSKRIDFVLSGYDDHGQSSATIIELKQWSKVALTEKDGIVEAQTGGNGAYRETSHPSYQAMAYRQLLYDFNEFVYTSDLNLTACAYLHNCSRPEAIRSERYQQYLNKAPVFIKNDLEKLISFITKNVTKGDRGKLLYEIDAGKIRPSKVLADHMISLLDGNAEFSMIDDQKLVYETALEMAASSTIQRKSVLIVEGGPGTGKSVVAINLLVEFLNRRLNARYLSPNQAPRAVYERRLSGSMTRERISYLFRGTSGYVVHDPGDFDCLIVDESHRLVAKTRYQPGKNQMQELIRAANCTVFFIDESQRVTMNDIGTVDDLKKFAIAESADVVQLELASQFRCNGSDGYLAWLDNTLGVRDTANENLEGIDYDFRVCDSPTQLRELIIERNKDNNKSRMVAGYCWPWVSKKNPTKMEMDIVFPEFGFEMQWNFDRTKTWLVDAESVQQIGCIHTCQGLELEYVGVILGEDFLIRNGRVVCSFDARAPNDKSWHGYKKLRASEPEKADARRDEIVKNTYRVLMSRGQKGCFVWSVDPETNDWLKTCASNAR